VNGKSVTLSFIYINSPASVQDIQIPQDKSNQWITVSLKDGTEITTRLLASVEYDIVVDILKVGADGKDSIVRTAANIPSLGYSYNQKGVVCAVEHSTPNTTAWQRFLPSGPVALLPVLYSIHSTCVLICITDVWKLQQHCVEFIT
jgi:ubiquinone biosynthesis monooxygenase Coq6